MEKIGEQEIKQTSGIGVIIVIPDQNFLGSSVYQYSCGGPSIMPE